MPDVDDRASIVAYIQERAAQCDAKKDDVQHGHYYRGLVTIYRALATDIAAKLDLPQ